LAACLEPKRQRWVQLAARLRLVRDGHQPQVRLAHIKVTVTAIMCQLYPS
jgi:hypothetical protein